MARYTGPKCRLCRREGMKLFLKGKRCDSVKCPFSEQKNRGTPPGQASWRRGKTSTFGKALREKQRLKRFYGMAEKPLRRYFHTAYRAKLNTGDALLIMVERRLDNVVRRFGLGFSGAHSRQLVAHGHVYVNSRRVDRPSYLVKAGDIITVSKKERLQNVMKEALEQNKKRTMPSWLEFDPNALQGKVLNLPSADEAQVVGMVRMQPIVELSSR